MKLIKKKEVYSLENNSNGKIKQKNKVIYALIGGILILLVLIAIIIRMYVLPSSETLAEIENAESQNVTHHVAYISEIDVFENYSMYMSNGHVIKLTDLEDASNQSVTPSALKVGHGVSYNKTTRYEKEWFGQNIYDTGEDKFLDISIISDTKD